PLYLFQAVQASLLPKLSALAHAGHLGDFRSGLRRLLLTVAGLAALGAAGGALVGPFVVEIMFPGADLGTRTMGLLAAGAGLYMLALACAQAVIALGGHADQALGWFLGLASLLVTVAVASDDLFLRVEIALLVGSAVAFVAMAGLLLRRLAGAGAGPLHVDEGDLIEAMHEVPLEPGGRRRGRAPGTRALVRLLSRSLGFSDGPRAHRTTSQRGCPNTELPRAARRHQVPDPRGRHRHRRRDAPAAGRGRPRPARAGRGRPGRPPRGAAHPPGHARELDRVPRPRPRHPADRALRQRRAVGVRRQDAGGARLHERRVG